LEPLINTPDITEEHFICSVLFITFTPLFPQPNSGFAV
jgi:hypothetical protein